MGEYVVRSAAVRQHHLGKEPLEIADIVQEPVDMAAARIAQQAVGAALSAPVDQRGAEAQPLKVAHGLEILLDALVAALQQDRRAARPAAAVGKQRVAAADSVEARHMARLAPLGQRIVVGLVECRLHGDRAGDESSRR
jgi:hypothetical protein